MPPGHSNAIGEKVKYNGGEIKEERERGLHHL